MKVGQLRAAIRSAKGVVPTIEIALYPGAPVIPFALQKQSLLDELDKAFPGGKTVETGIAFNEKTGVLSAEFGASVAVQDDELTNSAPNAENIAAMEDVRSGKTERAASIDDLFLDTPESTGLDDLLI